MNEKTNEKMIELTNGAFVIVKINGLIEFKEYKNFIKRAEKAIKDGCMVFPSNVDVIVIDKEGKAVKA